MNLFKQILFKTTFISDPFGPVRGFWLCLFLGNRLLDLPVVLRPATLIYLFSDVCTEVCTMPLRPGIPPVNPVYLATFSHALHVWREMLATLVKVCVGMLGPFKTSFCSSFWLSFWLSFCQEQKEHFCPFEMVLSTKK